MSDILDMAHEVRCPSLAPSKLAFAIVSNTY